jgi:hypothetical protein
MTDLRTAAQEALEALGKWSIGYHVDAVELNDLIATLGAALEQPVPEYTVQTEYRDPSCVGAFNRAKPEHITDGSPCWCDPELNYVDPETGAKVWVHKETQ